MVSESLNLQGRKENKAARTAELQTKKKDKKSGSHATGDTIKRLRSSLHTVQNTG